MFKWIENARRKFALIRELNSIESQHSDLVDKCDAEGAIDFAVGSLGLWNGEPCAVRRPITVEIVTRDGLRVVGASRLAAFPQAEELADLGGVL